MTLCKNNMPLTALDRITKLRRRWLTGILITGTLSVVVPAHAQESPTPAPGTKRPLEIVVPKSFAGDTDFEEACRLRLNIDSVDTLKEIIALAKSAVDKGLDPSDMEAAKKLIATSYLQKTQEGIRTIASGMSRSKINKRLNDFLQDLGEAIKFDPLLADAYLMKVELHASLKEPAAARDVANDGISVLVPIVDSKVADPETKVKLSRLLMMRAGLQSEPDEAISDLKKSIDFNPNNQAGIVVLLQSLAQNNRSNEALEFFQKVLDSNPENELIIQSTAELLASKQDQFKDALELLNAKLKLLPDSAALLKIRGKVHAMNSESALAKADLDRALELSKNDIDGLLTRARIAMEVSEHDAAQKDSNLDAARKDVDTAIELAPDRVGSILLRAAIARKQERYGDAIVDMRLIVKNQPKEEPNLELLMELGLLYSLDDRPTEAIRVFGQVIKQDSEYWQAYSFRGDTLLAMKDYSKAIADFEKALELSPKDNKERSGILNNLSWTLSTSLAPEVRNGKRALELGIEACELTEYKKPHILSTLAAAYAETGQFDKAIEWSEKAVELGKESHEPQLEQLEAELESYHKKEPWREKTEAKQNKAPIAPNNSGVDT